MKKQFISFLLLICLLLLAACGNTNEKEATEPNNNRPMKIIATTSQPVKSSRSVYCLRSLRFRLSLPKKRFF